MAVYQNFAQCYDLFMSETPYDEWVEFVERIFAKHRVKPGLILDLACGTGNITTRLSKKGYDVIGLDSSEEMLSAAKSKDGNILYICQDMRSFELYGTVDCILCLCDGMNYITARKDLQKVFSLAANYLNRGGLFIFDLNTEYKYAHKLADGTFAQTKDTAAYIWENSYDARRRINEYAVTFFTQTPNGLYRRFEEIHRQKAHTIPEIREAAQKAGFSVLDILNMDTQALKIMSPPNSITKRVCITLGVNK